MPAPDAGCAGQAIATCMCCSIPLRHRHYVGRRPPVLWPHDALGIARRWSSMAYPLHRRRRAQQQQRSCITPAYPRGTTTFFLGSLICVLLTFCAKRSEHSDSCANSLVGATLTNMSVLASPPRHGCSR